MEEVGGNATEAQAPPLVAPQRRLLTGNDDEPLPQRRALSAYSRFPGDARDSRLLPNVQQIFVRDFDHDRKLDLFLHAPALSPGSCAQRCHSLGRFGCDTLRGAPHRLPLARPAGGRARGELLLLRAALQPDGRAAPAALAAQAAPLAL